MVLDRANVQAWCSFTYINFMNMLTDEIEVLKMARLTGVVGTGKDLEAMLMLLREDL